MSVRCIGVGAVTPHGTWMGAAVREGLRRQRATPAADGGWRLPELDADPCGGARGWRRMSNASRHAFAAVVAAARDAGCPADAIGGQGVACVVATRYGSLSRFEEFHAALRDEGPRAVSPTVFTTGVLNAPTGHTSLELGLRGPTHTVVGGEAAGLEALVLASELLSVGVARRVFAVGVEELAPLLLAGLHAASAMPAGGTVGEGAIALLLERDGDRGPTLLDARLGHPGRTHHAPTRHRALLAAALTHAGVAPGDVAECWRALDGGADGAREAAACSGLPAPISVTPALGYAPALASLAAAAGAALAPAGLTCATAAGGNGATGVCVWRAP